MSPRKLLLLTVVVAVLFGFILLFERRMPSTEERQRKGDLYWDIPEERLESLTLRRGEETLEFRKTDSTPWRMIKPAAYPADAFTVDAVAGELADLKRAGGDGGDAKPSDYGLEKPVASATLVWSEAGDPAAKKTRTVAFGMTIPGTDVVAALREGSTRVLFVPSSVLVGVRRSVDDFRSRDVFGGVAADISRVEILRGRGRLVLSRVDGDWWLTEPIKDLASSEESDRLARQLTGLRVVAFLPANEDLAAIGLDPPLYRVAVTGPGDAKVSVDIGATRADGNNVYASRDRQVFTVGRDVVDDLSTEVDAFRSAALVAFRRADVTMAEGTFANGSFALTRKDGGWTSADRPVLAPAADDLLTSILGLKSLGFLDAGRVGELPPAAATVTVRRKVGGPWTVSFHARGEDLVARVSSRPGLFSVDRDAPRRLEAAFQKAVAPPATPAPTGTKKP